MENEIVIITNEKQNNINLYNDGKQANNLHNSIKSSLDDVSKKFLVLGYYFNRMNEYKAYESFGYSSIYDYGKECFNLGQTTIKNFIALFNKFGKIDSYSGDCYCHIELKDEYKDYSYSQLVELVSVPEDQIKSYSPALTVSEIRQNKKLDEYQKNVVSDLEKIRSTVCEELNKELLNYSFKGQRNLKFIRSKDFKIDYKTLSIVGYFKIVETVSEKENKLDNTLKIVIIFKPGYSKYCITYEFSNKLESYWKHDKTIELDNLDDFTINMIFSQNILNFIDKYMKDYCDFLYKEIQNNIKEKNKENIKQFFNKKINFNQYKVIEKMWNISTSDYLFKFIEKFNVDCTSQCLYVYFNPRYNYVYASDVYLFIDSNLAVSFTNDQIRLHRYNFEENKFNNLKTYQFRNLFNYIINNCFDKFKDNFSQTSDQEDD